MSALLYNLLNFYGKQLGRNNIPLVISRDHLCMLKWLSATKTKKALLNFLYKQALLFP